MAVQDFIQNTAEYQAATATESQDASNASSRDRSGEAFNVSVPNDVDALEALQVVLLVLIYLELRGGG